MNRYTLARFLRRVADMLAPLPPEPKPEPIDLIMDSALADLIAASYSPRPADGPLTRQVRLEIARQQAEHVLRRACWPWHRNPPTPRA